MKELGRNIEKQILNAITKTAAKCGEISSSSTCTWWFHQPEFPEKMKSLKKESGKGK